MIEIASVGYRGGTAPLVVVSLTLCNLRTSQHLPKNPFNPLVLSLVVMAGLSNIVTELLLGILQRLDSIDDALHLAQCSKRNYAVSGIHRFLIMKAIIVRTKSLVINTQLW